MLQISTSEHKKFAAATLPDFLLNDISVCVHIFDLPSVKFVNIAIVCAYLLITVSHRALLILLLHNRLHYRRPYIVLQIKTVNRISIRADNHFSISYHFPLIVRLQVFYNLQYIASNLLLFLLLQKTK